jgi:peptidoglycan hydrolase-like protein with peptidoglycan-binding domain
VRQLQRWLLELGYAKSTDRGIIDAQGQPRGVMNDATVAAVVAFKKEHQLGAAPSANREVVTKMVGLRSTK